MLRSIVRSGPGVLVAIGLLAASLVAMLVTMPPMLSTDGTDRSSVANVVLDNTFAPAAPAQVTPDKVTVIDDFEHPDWPDPALWEWDRTRGWDYLWGPRTCRKSSGEKGLWAVGGGDLGTTLGCGKSYPAGVRSVVYVNLDLKPYASANPLELVFDIAADQISDSSRGDFLSVIYRRPDPEIGLERVPVIEWTGATGPSMQFQTWRINLLDVVDKYDTSRRYNLAGQEVQFEFMFRAADDSDQRGEGPHIDKLRVEYGAIAEVVPTEITPWPTVTEFPPTPSITPTPSQTLTPSPTPTKTRVPDDPTVAKLPLLLRYVVKPDYERNPDWMWVGVPVEPESLYMYAGPTTTSVSHLFGAIYDGPLDVKSYEHHPVIVEKVPSLEAGDGSVRVRYVTVQEGERYVDAATDEVKTASERISNLPQMRVRFDLKSGIRWQDGTEVVAEDSVFSQQVACNGDTPGSKYKCERTSAYSKQDERGVEWQGLPGFSDPDYAANFYAPLPRHQPSTDGRRMDALSAGEVLADEVYATAPYSYGPFQVDLWLPGERIVLVPNEHYWRFNEELPRQPHLVFSFIADPDQLLDALYERRIDVVTHDGLLIGQFDELEEARNRGRLTPRYAAGPDWEHITFNLNPEDDRVALGACREIRRAVALGTDRSTMVRTITRRHATVLDAFQVPEHWAYAKPADVTTYPFDLATAADILDTMGFQDANNDGVREAQREIVCATTDIDGASREERIPAGTLLKLNLQVLSGNVVRDQYVAMFQSNMSDLGIRIDVEPASAETLYRSGAPGPLHGRRFDLVAQSWRAHTLPDAWRHTCAQIPRAENDWTGSNSAGYCDPAFDALVMDATSKLERADSIPIYLQSQAHWSQDLPVLPLFQQIRVAAIAPKLTGFSLDTMTPSETWDVENWENYRPED